jgi:hypothetical protein
VLMRPYMPIKPTAACPPRNGVANT